MERLESIKLEDCSFFIRDVGFIEFFKKSAVDIELMSEKLDARINFFETMLGIYESTYQKPIESKTYSTHKKPYWYKKIAELRVESNICDQLEQVSLIPDILQESINLLQKDQCNLTVSSEYAHRLLKMILYETNI